MGRHISWTQGRDAGVVGVPLHQVTQGGNVVSLALARYAKQGVVGGLEQHIVIGELSLMTMYDADVAEITAPDHHASLLNDCVVPVIELTFTTPACFDFGIRDQTWASARQHGMMVS